VITKSGYYETIEKFLIPIINNKKLDGVMLSNISQYDVIKKFNLRMYANYTLNLFNDNSLQMVQKLGFKGALVNLELNKKQISKLEFGKLEKELIIYGNIPLITTELCVLGKCMSGKCVDIKIVDRLGYNFNVFRDCKNCINYILNSKVLCLLNEFDIIEKMNVDSYRFIFFKEKYDYINKILNYFDLVRKHKENSILYSNSLNFDEFTKGHFNRGV
jgi:putative protease